MGVYTRPDSPWWWLYLETAPKGQRKVKTEIRVGTTTAHRHDSRKLAEDLYHLRMRDLAIDRHDLPRTRQAISFDDYASWYDAHVITHHRGWRREREILKALRLAFRQVALSAIDVPMVMEWRSGRATAASASTANRETALLKAMLTVAVPKYIPASPLAGLKQLRQQERETFVLSPADEQKLLRALRPPDRALVICALDTLMRLSDVVNLKRVQDRQTYIVVEDPKVKPYKVPVSTRLRAVLDRLPQKGAYYFPHRRVAKDSRDYRGSVQSMLERACVKAGITYGRKHGGITFHALRHTGATRLAERGISLRVIQQLGGWQSLRQLERYAHPGEAALRSAVEIIGAQPSPVAKRKSKKHTRKRRAA